MNKIRKQHIVWKYYLKQWATNEQLFCLRNNTVFKTNLNNIANIRDFYRLKELSTNDMHFLKYMVNKIQSPTLRRIDEGWINSLTEIFRLRENIIEGGFRNSKTNEMLDVEINNIEEKMHSKIEQTGIEFLNSILNHDLSFYETDDGIFKFTLYLCMQYFRTEKMQVKINLSDIVDDGLGIKMDNVWSILRILYANNMAYTLYVNKEEWKIQLVLNESQDSFITGDQPVINEHSILDGITTELCLYYPVSPRTAIKIINISEKANDLFICKGEDTQKQNNLMKMNSYQQLYGYDEKSLIKLITETL